MVHLVTSSELGQKQRLLSCLVPGPRLDRKISFAGKRILRSRLKCQELFEDDLIRTSCIYANRLTGNR